MAICSIFLSDENSNMYEEVDKLSSETRSGSSLSSVSPVYENAAMVAGKSASRQTRTVMFWL
ncbi:hypothetical protein HID58_086232 [Brassica napus]|uniref:Uncharacterized protein n=1 Tax=Brassica napus TaxID=3708 RepID=A0ABQ7XPW0_BRANA|nr:hypothetical protein HID58_086232 [Brassica napus]